jgi:transcriptional regulator with XRE-family HTH domain
MNLLSERMSASIKYADIKKTDLATSLKVSRATVTDWCSGKIKNIRGDNLFKAAKTLGVRPEWLASGTGEMVANRSQGSDWKQESHSDEALEMLKLYEALSPEDRDRLLTVGMGFRASAKNR